MGQSGRCLSSHVLAPSRIVWAVGGTSGRLWGSLASAGRATLSARGSLVSWPIMTRSLLGLGWSLRRAQSTLCGPDEPHGRRVPGESHGRVPGESRGCWVPGSGERCEVSGGVDGMVAPAFTLPDLG